MSESCQGVTNRSRVSNHEPDEGRSCEGPKEDPQAARIRADREAEARREAWSRGEGERGMSSRQGSSQVAPTPPVCTGPTQQERAAAETARRDKPLEHDVIGNMIPGMFVGGLMAGLEAGAAGAGVRGIAGHVAEHVVVDVEADLVAHDGAHAAGAAGGSHGRTQHAPAQTPSAATRPSSTEPSRTADPAPAGRSSSRASSEIVKEPTQSTPEPPPVGRDRPPYPPGRAPVVIPEPPVITIRG